MLLGLQWVLPVQSHSTLEALPMSGALLHVVYYPHFLYLSFNTAINRSARQMSARLSPVLFHKTQTMHFARCKSMWERATYLQPEPWHMVDLASVSKSRTPKRQSFDYLGFKRSNTLQPFWLNQCLWGSVLAQAVSWVHWEVNDSAPAVRPLP